MNEFKPGFYIDPLDSGRLRHFNGETWDSITRDRTEEDVFNEVYTTGPSIEVDPSMVYKEPPKATFEEKLSGLVESVSSSYPEDPLEENKAEHTYVFGYFSFFVNLIKNTEPKVKIAMGVLFLVWGLASIVSASDSLRAYEYNSQIANKTNINATVTQSNTTRYKSTILNTTKYIVKCSYNYSYVVNGTTYQGVTTGEPSNGSTATSWGQKCVKVGGEIPIAIDGENPIVASSTAGLKSPEMLKLQLEAGYIVTGLVSLIFLFYLIRRNLKQI